MTVHEALRHCAERGDRTELTFLGGATLTGTIQDDGDDQFVFLIPRRFTTPIATFLIPDMIAAVRINRETLYEV